MLGSTPSSVLGGSMRRLKILVVLSMLLGMVAPFAQVTPTSAASVISAAFTGGPVSNGIMYARQGMPLTLTVSVDSNTQCVRVTDGTTSIDKDTSSSPQTWVFTPA